jgi:translation initiation factor 1
MGAGDKKSSSPFAKLAALRDQLPQGPQKNQAPTREESAAQFDEKVIVARSKKGRGGKVVTTIAGVRAEAREAMAQELRRSFGCGATVEDDLIIIQGDQVPRTRGFLEARGVRKVILGS